MIARFLTPGAVATLIPMAVVAIVGGVISWQYQDGLRRERDMVAHTWEVIATAGGLLAAATDAETGQRGYIITGDSAFLAPYMTAEADLPRLLAQLRTQLSDNADQTKQIDRLNDVFARKMTELDAGAAIRRTQGLEAARAFVAQSEGKALLDEARSIVAGVMGAERSLLDERIGRVRFRERWVVAVGLVTALLSTASRGLVVAWRRRRNLPTLAD